MTENILDINEQNAYLPLFRKYRPQSFDDVIGQEFTVKALKNAIQLKKIVNAYLFCGPRGTGKTSCARIFAKSLNCIEGPTVSPCQKCQSCLDVTNASGLDVIEIDAATNRGIDDAKELISKVQYAPMNGKYKIFIIDEVHMLSKEAFNALLKTFEEPPENVIFILATTEPHKVIETIVSRCQRFDFRRITIDDIVKRLSEIAQKEKINIDKEALFAIAKNVSGGMRDSLALLDQASILGIDKKITKETIETLIGKLTFDVLYELLNNILNKDIKASIDNVEAIYEKGSEPRNFIENLIEFLRNVVLVLSSKNENEAMDLTLFSAENINKIKQNELFNQDKILKILDKIIEFSKEIKNTANPYLWAELAIINVSSVDLYSTPSAPILNPAPIQAKIEPKPEPKVEPKVETKPEAPKSYVQILEENINYDEDLSVNENELTEIQKPEPIIEAPKIEAPIEAPKPQTDSSNPAGIWAEILNKVDSIPAKFFYSGVGKLISIENGHITLGFVNSNAIVQAKSDNKYNPLLKAMQAILGENCSIEFITIEKDTKIIDAKINVKVQEKPQTQQVPKKPEYNPKTDATVPDSFFDPEPVKSAPKKEGYKSGQGQNGGENKWKQRKKDAPEPEETPDYSEYTKATREMLETFGGRVIEE